MGDKGTATKGQKKGGIKDGVRWPQCHLCGGEMVMFKTCSDRQWAFAVETAWGRPGKLPGVCNACMPTWENMCYYGESKEDAQARLSAEAQKKKKKEGEEETQNSLGKGKGNAEGVQ